VPHCTSAGLRSVRQRRRDCNRPKCCSQDKKQKREQRNKGTKEQREGRREQRLPWRNWDFSELWTTNATVGKKGDAAPERPLFAPRRHQSQWSPSRLIPHRHR